MVQWLRLHLPMQGVRVQSLVGMLRSHMPRGQKAKHKTSIVVTLESPLDCKEIQPVHPKGISLGCSLQRLMLMLKLQNFGHLMRRTDSLKKTLMLGKTEGRRRRGRPRMRWLDGITDLMDMSRVSSGS